VAAVAVGVEGSPSGEGLVRPDRVEQLPVGLAFEAELVAVVDLVPVEVFVFQRAEGAFADAVLAWALAAGTDVTAIAGIPQSRSSRFLT
jgi:hypothetical protein